MARRHEDGTKRPLLGRDFGSVAVDSIDTKAFTIRNIGSDPLEIDVSAPTDPVFTVVTFDRSIPCFKEGSLQVQCKPTEVRAYAASVALKTNDPQRPRVELKLKAEGIAADKDQLCGDLRTELADLQQQLKSATGPSKQEIMREIREVEAQMRRLGCQ